MKMKKKYILYSLIFTMFCGISIFAVKTTFRVTNAAKIIYPIPISTGINTKSFSTAESFSTSDLFYRKYKNSIYLAKNSALRINLSPIEDLSNDFEIAIVNCETETTDILDRKNYSQKYNIEQNGHYQIFLREKEKQSYHSWVNITSKANIGVEGNYSIDDKNEIYLIN